jgi:hypothetical protein
MCKDPNLAKAHNDGKCWGIVCLVFGIIELLSFFGGNVGGGVAGIFSIIAGSMPLCCLKPDNTKCIFMASAIIMIPVCILDIVGAALAGALIGTFGDVASLCADTCNQVYSPGSLLSQCLSGCGATNAVVSTASDFVNTWAYVVIAICIIMIMLHIAATVFFCKAANVAAGGSPQMSGVVMKS